MPAVIKYFSSNYKWGELEKNNYKEGILKDYSTNIINKTLFDSEIKNLQYDIIKEIMNKNCSVILSAEMGVGKTYIALGLTRLIRMLNPNKKIIITCTSSSHKTFINLFQEALGEFIVFSNGGRNEIDRLKKYFDSAKIFIVTHSFWINSKESLKFIYNNVEEFVFSFWDESDKKDAAGFEFYAEFSRLLPYKVVSNATPVGKDINLTYNQLYSVGATDLTRHKFKTIYGDNIMDYNNMSRKETININKIKNDFEPFFINKNRSELGVVIDYDITFHRANVTLTQVKWIEYAKINSALALYAPESNSAIIKGDSLGDKITKPELNPETVDSYRLLQELVDNIDKESKTMIYCKYKTTMYKLVDYIKENTCLNPYVFNGESSNLKDIESKFNQDENGIAVVNITKAINLDSVKRIILYGIPADIMQTIFRGVRSIENKTLLLDIIYYPEKEYKKLEETLKHISDIDVITKRDTSIIHYIEKELFELPEKYGIKINIKKEQYRNNLNHYNRNGLKAEVLLEGLMKG